LHAALKAWYAQPGDLLEESVDGFWIDIVRGDLLIEVQTRSFAKIKGKLVTLLASHPVRLIYPVAQEKWIVRVAADGVTPVSRRKSPKRGRIEDLFGELVSFPELILHPNFAVEVVLVRAEEVYRDDGKGSWRRKGWSVHDHRLIDVVGQVMLASAADFRLLLPPTLGASFTGRELATAAGMTVRLAQKMLYCLRRMGVVEVAGKRGRALVYGVDRGP
jgi:hypothetical protein